MSNSLSTAQIASALDAAIRTFGSIDGLIASLLALDEEQQLDLAMDCVISWRGTGSVKAMMVYHMLTGESIAARFTRRPSPQMAKQTDPRNASRDRAARHAAKQHRAGASLGALAADLSHRTGLQITPEQAGRIIEAVDAGGDPEWPADPAEAEAAERLRDGETLGSIEEDTGLSRARLWGIHRTEAAHGID